MARLFKILFSLQLFTLASPALAADFQVSQDLHNGCLIEMSGPIAEGDVARLQDAIIKAKTEHAYGASVLVQDPGPQFRFSVQRPLNLCLDSPGGSFAEAGALAQLVNRNMGTMVRAGEGCLSACALLFMAGATALTEADFGLNVNRFLHVDGQLGFHAPSLVVPAGQYGAETVQRAYEVSVEATTEILRNLLRYKVPPSLAARMHATPAHEMFYVTRVEEAARWGIAILGVDAPHSLSETTFRNACGNLYSAAFDQLTSDDRNWLRELKSGGPWRKDAQGRVEIAEMGPSFSGVCTLETGQRSAAATAALLEFSWGTSPSISDSVWGSGKVTGDVPALTFGYLQNHMAWPGRLPLKALPRGSVTTPVTLAGQCTLFGDAGDLQEDGPCTITYEARPDGGAGMTYVLQSGHVWTIENRGGRLSLDSTELWNGYWMGDGPNPQITPICMQRSDTGQTLCVQDS